MDGIIQSNNNSALRPNSLAEERLIVRDKDNLHLLGRFIQALFLDYLKKPGKVKIIKQTRLTAAFDPSGHPEEGLTLIFRQGRVFLESGVRADAQIRIMGEPALLMMLTRMPSGWPLVKYFMSYEGRDILKRIRYGELKLKGVFRHPIEMMKFAGIMAPNVN